MRSPRTAPNCAASSATCTTGPRRTWSRCPCGSAADLSDASKQHLQHAVDRARDAGLTVEATDSVPGTDPDRAGFTTAPAAARDQLVLAAGIITGTVTDLVGAIGRHVLAHLQPARRIRTKDRIVKRAISKYNARGPAIDRTTYKPTINITMLTSSP
ncbi:hypothetical protein Shyhy02_41020 [Streptomyces hygroscopicus subsp. hygroscopicus]|nr:hypothetical protein [Streptomyces hygroscopicus]GLV76102.1 hypothetical protein Shyhy02_41020 [Streptomyces hygroscopicus subsp. hygroscopicus]